MNKARLLLLPFLLLGGCATSGGDRAGGDIPAGADVTSKTMGPRFRSAHVRSSMEVTGSLVHAPQKR